MNKIHVLDCTLRDGGYCNNWNFGLENSKKIISSLEESNIDVIECGFLTEKVDFNSDVTKFNNLEQIKDFLPKKNKNTLYVAMINYGEFDVKSLPICDGKTLDGMRVAFHKKNVDEALKDCSILKSKGYKVFVQPMVSLCYTDEEFLSLIHKTNDLNPYAFYIVDSFGMMKKKDLTRLFYVVEHNLNDSIWIGFHSHNNMQLAYSNAQILADIQTSRNLIVDASVFGMGRGAGNLNTELFLDYLNENLGTDYDIKPLLNIIDEVLNKFYQNNYWGYSLPNYLSALHYVHPNYALYLDDKKTLTVQSMNEIFSMMSEEKKYEFDKEYIEQLYLDYNATGKTMEIHKTELGLKLKGKNVLLIAPGKIGDEDKVKIHDILNDESYVSVSINFDYQDENTDFIFLSNLRRYRELKPEKYSKAIVTANIPSTGVYLQTKYRELINDVESVRDNAGLMAVKFFINLGVKKICLAGFNGYSHELSENYSEQSMMFITKNAILDSMNQGMSKMLKEYSKEVQIEFVTKPVYLNV